MTSSWHLPLNVISLCQPSVLFYLRNVGSSETSINIAIAANSSLFLLDLYRHSQDD